MKNLSTPLVISLVLVSFIGGLTTGFYISPQYQQTMYEKHPTDLGPADRLVDLRYLNSMAEHHMAAILLAQQIEGKTEREELQNLAREIQADEPALIAELYTWKSDWFGDTTQVKPPTVAQLGPADETVDLRFLNALIAHHEMGIEMTQEVRLKSSRPEILNNADTVEQFLEDTLVTLKEMRKEWFNV